jgi:hypothetical protein
MNTSRCIKKVHEHSAISVTLLLKLKKGVLDVAHLKRQVLHSSWSIANMPVLNCSFDSNSQLPQPAEDFSSFLRVAGTCQHTSSDLQKKSKEPPKLFLWLILAFDIRN